MTDYEIRPFRPRDREAYLELYETVLGAARDPAWFEWKYGAENPYVDEPAIFVAYGDGDLVGARSFFALRMAVGDATRLALQPSDAMVHPEHRRQGLFSRMTTDALARYADREPAFCFNFPNPKSLPGNLKLGWEVVGDLTTHYRVHDPAALTDAQLPLASALRAAATSFYRFRTPTATDARLSVSRRESDPETLAALYGRAIEDAGGNASGRASGRATGRAEGHAGGIHALRDETFYEWRLSAPGRRYETYVADRGGEPTAALVVARNEGSGGTIVRILDALAVGESDAENDAYAALLSSVLEDHRDAALVAVRGGLPDGVLRQFGFLPDTSLPLSPVSSTTTMVARPIGDADWVLDGRDLRDPESWRLTFAELDSA